MAASKTNRVRVVARNDGKYKIRIVNSQGKTLAESEKLYERRASAVTAAKSLADKPLEVDLDS